MAVTYTQVINRAITDFNSIQTAINNKRASTATGATSNYAGAIRDYLICPSGTLTITGSGTTAVVTAVSAGTNRTGYANVSVPAASGFSTTVAPASSATLTVGSLSSNRFPITVSAFDVTFSANTNGWFSSGSKTSGSVQVGTIAKATGTNTITLNDLSISDGSDSFTPTISLVDTDGSNAGKNIATVSVPKTNSTYNLTTTEPSSGYYISVKSNAGTSKVVSAVANAVTTFSQAGYVRTSGDNISATQQSKNTSIALNASSITYVPITAANITVSATSPSTSMTPTLSKDSSNTNVSSSAIQSSKPGSGYYVAFKSDANSTGITVTAKTESTAGYTEAFSGNSAKTATKKITLSASGSYYIPITASTLTIGNASIKPTLSLLTTDSSSSNGVNLTGSGITNTDDRLLTTSLTTTEPTEDYFFAIRSNSGSTSSTISVTDGYITSASSGNSTFTLNASDTYYIPVPKATFSYNQSSTGATFIQCSKSGYILSGTISNISGTIDYATVKATLSGTPISSGTKPSDAYAISVGKGSGTSAGYITATSGEGSVEGADTYWVAKGSLQATNGAVTNASATVAMSNTTSNGVKQDLIGYNGVSGSGIQSTVPSSGTLGTNYFRIKPTLSVTSGSVGASTAKMKTAGYLPANSSVTATTDVSVPVNQNGNGSGQNEYYVLASTLNNNLTNSVSVTSSGTANQTVTVSSGYYSGARTITINKMSGASVTLTNTVTIENNSTSPTASGGKAKTSDNTTSPFDKYVYVSASGNGVLAVNSAGYISTAPSNSSNSDTARIAALVGSGSNGSTTVTAGKPTATTSVGSATTFYTSSDTIPSGKTVGSIKNEGQKTNSSTIASVDVITSQYKDMYIVGGLSAKTVSDSTTKATANLNATGTGTTVDTYLESLYKRYLGQSYTDVTADA